MGEDVSRFRVGAVRKIRHGRVKIAGRWYVPDPQYTKYDGRLDGMVAVFGRYQGKPELVSLCGIAAELDSDSGKRSEVVDGFLPWLFWHEQPTDAIKEAK